MNQLHALTAQWHASENREKRCPLCHSEFGWLLNRGDKCCQCNARVCDKCRLSAVVKENWLCTLCFKQMLVVNLWYFKDGSLNSGTYLEFYRYFRSFKYNQWLDFLQYQEMCQMLFFHFLSCTWCPSHFLFFSLLLVK